MRRLKMRRHHSKRTKNYHCYSSRSDYNFLPNSTAASCCYPIRCYPQLLCFQTVFYSFLAISTRPQHKQRPFLYFSPSSSDAAHSLARWTPWHLPRVPRPSLQPRSLLQQLHTSAQCKRRCAMDSKVWRHIRHICGERVIWGFLWTLCNVFWVYPRPPATWKREPWVEVVFSDQSSIHTNIRGFFLMFHTNITNT